MKYAASIKHLLCEWRLHESPLKLRLSAMLPKAGLPKATQDLKLTHLGPTWGIKAVRVILGGVGCEDVHPRVVRSTDGIGVDPGNHHMPFYEPVPAKENQRSSTCNSVIRDFIKSHPRPFHAVQNFLPLTPGHVRVFNNWVTQKPKQQQRDSERDQQGWWRQSDFLGAL